MSPRASWFGAGKGLPKAESAAEGEAAGASEDPTPVPRRRTRVVTLMGLVAACALLAWALRDAFAPAQYWARQLRNGTNEERQEAASRLGQLPARDAALALEALTAALGDEDEQVVMNAVFALGRVAGPALAANDRDTAQGTIAAMEAMLRDPRPSVRAAVVAAMPSFKPAASPSGSLTPDTSTDEKVLVAALGDPSDTVRVAAARRAFQDLSLRNPPEERPLLGPLIKALQSDPSSTVRREAARVLGRFQVERDRIVISLLRAMEAKDPVVRDGCVQALDWLRDGPRPGKQPITAAIVPELIQALGSEVPSIRCQAALLLGKLGSGTQESVRALMKLLREPVDPTVTASTRWAQAQWNDPGTVAARALGAIALQTPWAREAAEALTAVLRDEGFAPKRTAATEALGQFRPEEGKDAVPLLIARTIECHGKDLDFLRSACKALGRLGPGSPSADKAVGALATALDEHDADTRVAAAQALAEFGSHAKPSLGRLREIESDEMPWEPNWTVKKWVKDTAKDAIRRIEAS